LPAADELAVLSIPSALRRIIAVPAMSNGGVLFVTLILALGQLWFTISNSVGIISENPIVFMMQLVGTASLFSGMTFAWFGLAGSGGLPAHRL